MRLLTRVSLLAVFVFAAGCGMAPRRSARMPACFGSTTPVGDSNQRVVAQGFSVLPPAGANWCIRRTDTRAVVFYKNLFGGRVLTGRPRREEIAHTFAAHARLVGIDGPQPANAGELKAFVERWLRGGPGMRGRQLRVVANPRIKLLEAKAAVVTVAGASCVRYRWVAEERDNPRARGMVLVTVEPESLLCFHPHKAGLFFLVSYSERFPRHERPQPLLVESLQPELKPLLGSVKFTRVD